MSIVDDAIQLWFTDKSFDFGREVVDAKTVGLPRFGNQVGDKDNLGFGAADGCA
jgi:hypothetical protein